MKSLHKRLVEGELSHVEERALKKHLASCSMCRNLLALDLAIIETIRTSPDEAVESVAGEVMGRIAVRSRRFRVLRWGVVTAVLCLIGIVINSYGLGVFEYVVSLISGEAAARPEIAALGKIAGTAVGLAGSLGTMVVDGVGGVGPKSYLPYVLAVVIGGCLVVISMMYMMGLWLRKPGEVRS
jgi:anti-sigma factor RsiW